jgi:hypothetical protein
MVPEPTLRDLQWRVIQVLDEDVPGDLVECGVWRGGAAFLMADLLELRHEPDRKVWLFDSFEGLPPPQEIDGARAAAYAADVDNPQYHDNCRAALDEVRASAARLGLERRTEIVQGWFDATLPEARRRIGPIALLRLDCDWYEPVRLCLDLLYDQVSPGGTIVIDDYYTYDGCALAVHGFLASRALPLHLHEAQGVAYMRKPRH